MIKHKQQNKGLCNVELFFLQTEGGGTAGYVSFHHICMLILLSLLQIKNMDGTVYMYRTIRGGTAMRMSSPYKEVEITLLREVVDYPSLEVFKASLDGVLGSLM